MSHDFTPRLRSTVYPSRRRAVMWQGRLMRPANGVEVLIYGRSPTAGKPFVPVTKKPTL